MKQDNEYQQNDWKFLTYINEVYRNIAY